MINKTVILPMLETIYRSFMYVIHNIKTVCKISSIFLLLWPIGIYVEAKTMEATSWRDVFDLQILWFFLLATASTIVAVSLIRHIILKERTNWFHFSFGMNNVKFIGYVIFMFLFVFLPPTLILFGEGIIDYHYGISDTLKGNLSLLAFLVLIIAFFFSGRFYLIFTASAINDKKMSLASSFKMTAENTLKISCGIVLLVIPTILITKIINSFYTQPDLSLPLASFLVLLIMCCSFFDSAVKASYYSHLYQYFTYFNKEEKIISAPVETKKEAPKTDTKPQKAVTAPKKASTPKTATVKKTTTAPKASSKKAVSKTPAKAEPVAKKTTVTKTKTTSTKEKTAKTTKKPVASPKKKVEAKKVVTKKTTQK